MIRAFVPDVVNLQLSWDTQLLPKAQELAVAQMLEKDTGFLKTVLQLCKMSLVGEAEDEEDKEQKARVRRQVEQLLADGQGLPPSGEIVDDVRGFLVRWNRPMEQPGAADLLRYLDRSCKEERRRLLVGSLFARCLAAQLLGTCRGGLELGGCVRAVVDPLHDCVNLSISEVEGWASEQAAAKHQLEEAAVCATYVLDRMLQAGMKSVPPRLVVEGRFLHLRSGGSGEGQRGPALQRLGLLPRAQAGAGLQSAQLVVRPITPYDS
ncbi:hypothetical protein HYH03_018003 [Edaphochlamys debaryana]|uniref:Uncharacterized protein n=1 Tax=Edaphochlamys debaryana TaxID=47281 RepID=A0A835XHY3_9CHLO|nr:hypothetical protein HYH03_018003 [Edaphochlamys debaryana]|eukprot:KAG2483113.1 hypothetical protein HYH03_018003 [Edaphochlamys debaryana]